MNKITIIYGGVPFEVTISGGPNTFTCVLQDGPTLILEMGEHGPWQDISGQSNDPELLQTLGAKIEGQYRGQ